MNRRRHIETDVRQAGTTLVDVRVEVTDDEVVRVGGTGRPLVRPGRAAVRVVPDSIRQSLELWAGCVAGALSDTEYRDGLRDAGFTAVDIEPTRIYRAEDTAAMVEQVAGTSDLNNLGQSIDGAYISAFIRARKPQAI